MAAVSAAGVHPLLNKLGAVKLVMTLNDAAQLTPSG